MEKTEGAIGSMVEREDLRNMAIIAHVDHGKTTMTDALMKQTGMVEVASMDSNEQEMERGITILAKNAAVEYKGVKVNIIDTPGHADFGGEVERILNMADACLLLVDAQEGPMPQTKFVLRKALQLKKKVIVCINKVDKPAARCDWVLDKTFDLFMALGADDELADFPVVYSSGLRGQSSREGPESLEDSLTPLIQAILEETPKPKVDTSKPLQMLITNLDFDPYVGRISIGRVTSGTLKVGDTVAMMYGEGSKLREAKISKLWDFYQNERREVDEVKAGDCCAFTGFEEVSIGDTLVDPKNPLPMEPIAVEEPTVAMDFMTNRSPLAGKDDKSEHMTSGAIKTRLDKEILTNLSLRVRDDSSGDSFTVKGRGTLQLGILMENMRREGYEIMVGAPQVLTRKNPDTGATEEPLEEVTVDVPSEYQGAVMEEYSKKGGALTTMEAGAEENTLQMIFEIPTRSNIGIQGILMRRTKGSVCISSQQIGWTAHAGDVKMRSQGSIIQMDTGKATNYSLLKNKGKGEYFVQSGDQLYPGMCIGVHVKEQDVLLNLTKEKKATNMRAASADQTESVPSKLDWGIDEFLGFMDTDELLEITPSNIRLSKKSYDGKLKK